MAGTPAGQSPYNPPPNAPGPSDFTRVLASQPVIAPRPAPPAPPVAAPPAAAEGVSARPSKLPLILLIVVVVLTLALVLFFALRAGGGEAVTGG